MRDVSKEEQQTLMLRYDKYNEFRDKQNHR